MKLQVAKSQNIGEKGPRGTLSLVCLSPCAVAIWLPEISQRKEGGSQVGKGWVRFQAVPFEYRFAC
jgi:hypothetical protein